MSKILNRFSVNDVRKNFVIFQLIENTLQESTIFIQIEDFLANTVENFIIIKRDSYDTLENIIHWHLEARLNIHVEIVENHLFIGMI